MTIGYLVLLLAMLVDAIQLYRENETIKEYLYG